MDSVSLIFTEFNYFKTRVKQIYIYSRPNTRFDWLKNSKI